VSVQEPRSKTDAKTPAARTLPVTVRLTIAEMWAVSRAAVVVTSCGEPAFINATDRALRKLRDAAKKHPDLLAEPKGHR
jgi:hypothetical protein